MGRVTWPDRSRRGLVVLALLPMLGCTAAQTAAGTASGTVPAGASRSPAAVSSSQDADSARAFGELEKRFDARLGVFAVDTGSGRTVEHHADRRFAFASTIKALIVGTILREETDAELEEVIRYDREDLVTYSPVTEKHVGTGMTVRDLADAALRYSDNTAANLLIERIGSPKRLTAHLRRIGDRTTRADRWEPELNTAVPGDDRDTSTPRQLGADLRKFLLGNLLDTGDREILTDFMRRSTTGDDLIRAGVPSGWTVADKTGAGEYGTRNDIAVVWPPGRAPVVLAVLSTRTTQDATYDNALIAAATSTAVKALTAP